MSQVFGLVRFSYLPAESTGFALTGNRQFDERRRIVHDPARLQQRMRLFEAICLPSLAAQPSDRFAGLVLTSDKLPKPFADRLKKALAPYPNIHAAFLPPMSTQEAFSSAIADLPRSRSAANDIRITFRLDDDDAVSADFVDHIERYRKPQYHGFCISLSKGLGLCRLYGRTRIWERWHYMTAAGLAHVDSADSSKTVWDLGNHMRVAEVTPSIVDERRTAFLMTSHGSNDSSNRVPLKARFLHWTFMSQSVAAKRYGKIFPFLEKGDFGFVESSDFRIPGSQALRDVHRLRIDGIGKPEGAGISKFK